MTPFLAPPSARRAVITGALPGVIFPSTDNTCGCSGDQTYNKCGVSSNNCSPGYYPECNEGPYNCSCTCKPG